MILLYLRINSFLKNANTLKWFIKMDFIVFSNPFNRLLRQG